MLRVRFRAAAIPCAAVALGSAGGCASRAPVPVGAMPGIIVERADHGLAALRGERAAQHRSRATGYWEAIADFDLDAATRHAVARYLAGDQTGEEQRLLVEALRLAVAGRSGEADSALLATYRVSRDTVVRRVARLALTATLQYDGNWTTLAALSAPPRDSAGGGAAPAPAEPSYAAHADSVIPYFDAATTAAATAGASAGASGPAPAARAPTARGALDVGGIDGVGESGSGMAKASVEAWAKVFGRAPKARFAFPDAPVVLPLTRSATGVPMVPVRINGHHYVFWLDTGSSLTILSSTVAAASGVSALGADTLEAITATGAVAARPAVIPRVELGDVLIEDNSAMIVAAEQLSLERGDSGTVFVDGIIGFDAIRRMDLELDYPAGRATIRRPAEPDSASEAHRNIFWLGYPVVRLAAADGTPVNFGLDTGADESYASLPLLAKTGARTYLGERKSVEGFGKALKVRGRFIPRLRLTLRDTPVRLERVFVYVTHYPTLFALDGTLGGDVGSGGVVRIDMTRGVFAVGRSEGRKEPVTARR